MRVRSIVFQVILLLAVAFAFPKLMGGLAFGYSLEEGEGLEACGTSTCWYCDGECNCSQYSGCHCTHWKLLTPGCTEDPGSQAPGQKCTKTEECGCSTGTALCDNGVCKCTDTPPADICGEWSDCYQCYQHRSCGSKIWQLRECNSEPGCNPGNPYSQNPSAVHARAVQITDPTTTCKDIFSIGVDPNDKTKLTGPFLTGGQFRLYPGTVWQDWNPKANYDWENRAPKIWTLVAPKTVANASLNGVPLTDTLSLAKTCVLKNGVIPLYHIARFDQYNWQQVTDYEAEAKKDFIGADETIYKMKAMKLKGDSSERLYVAGAFTKINGLSANHIAAWNGTSWASVVGGVGFTIWDMVNDSAGNLFAVGSHTESVSYKKSDTSSDHITCAVNKRDVWKFDGSAWSQVGRFASDANFNFISGIDIGPDKTLYVGGQLIDITDSAGYPNAQCAPLARYGKVFRLAYPYSGQWEQMERVS